MSSSVEAGRQARSPWAKYEVSPWGKYNGGMHHLAQPTVDPETTLAFYVDMLGAEVTHAVTAKGWRPHHHDFIHMYLDLGKGDNIAMFYYFGVEKLEDAPKYGSHHSFGVDTIEELDRWHEQLEKHGYKVFIRSAHEIMTSIYAWDPNGRLLEVACNHRPLNEVDNEDGRYTAEALVKAAKVKAPHIDRMWNIKAELIEEREGGQVGSPALFVPGVDEFQPLIEAAKDSTVRQQKLGNYTAIEGDGELRIRRPEELRDWELREAIWNAFGTGGMKGVVRSRDENEIVIAAR